MDGTLDLDLGRTEWKDGHHKHDLAVRVQPEKETGQNEEKTRSVMRPDEPGARTDARGRIQRERVSRADVPAQDPAQTEQRHPTSQLPMVCTSHVSQANLPGPEVEDAWKDSKDDDHGPLHDQQRRHEHRTLLRLSDTSHSQRYVSPPPGTRYIHPDG